MARKISKLVHVGTSGWHYKHWKGPFYPADMKEKDFLAFYQERFRTVELNNSFYHLPLPQTLTNWHDKTPDDFLFAAKASRYITHVKRLLAPEETLPPFFERIELLAEKLGPILLQLPPGFKFAPERLESFLEALKPWKQHHYTIEFRNPTWFNEETYALLRRFGIAFCIFELGGLLTPDVVTADFVYIRLHGLDGKYAGSYTGAALAAWARKFKKWTKEGREVYCYFDNDQNGYAALNAMTLQELTK